ncbi:hypothetical protein ILYODFUR_029096 [Ilyodon furcidens]|uniref:Uncharacterized protein n=1 Tax=Ilyodon furcidens TaxID=33524 RepID=A0ABV0TZQ3_9TELE
MKIMTCSRAKSSGGFRGERDTSGDTKQYLVDRVCTQRFDSPRKNQSVCDMAQETWNCECMYASGCVCVFGCATEAQTVLKGNRCQTEGAEGSNLKLSEFRFKTFHQSFFKARVI